MSDQHEYEEEECGCGHHHGGGEECGCGHHHDGGEECGCGHHHDGGEECGCGHHHGGGEECGCGHHHDGGRQVQDQDHPYTVQGQMLGSSAVATGIVTVMAKYADIENIAKKELQGLADWVIGQNGSIVQMKSALVAIHSTMMAMTEDGRKMDTVIPEKEEIRMQLVTMANDVSLDELKSQLSGICERFFCAAQ